MKLVRWLGMIKRQQGLGLTQAFDGNDKAHVCKDPTNERGAEPEEFLHNCHVIARSALSDEAIPYSMGDCFANNRLAATSLRRFPKHDLIIHHRGDASQ